MHADPFGTESIRTRVLDTWSASPARFREDANAEEDLARGGYRDRVVVELAQNAADAATAAGVAGRLLLRLEGGVLLASNTGHPLDAEGVQSLSTLRASAKRAGDTSGRFGVGFAAVLAVTDEPSIRSSTGGVRWAAQDVRTMVAALPALTPELGRRHGHVPVLRLPMPSSGDPEPGFDTTVVLPLRDPVAVSLTRRLLDEVDDALLLALPGLTEVAVDVDGTRRVVGDAQRWHVVRRSGTLTPELLADRPVEERNRPWWSVTWALPVAGQPVPGTVYAPTPTDEPLAMAALLVASFPLDPARRHVAAGPLRDFLVQQAAAAFADLAAEVGDPAGLVPGPVAAGALDGDLRRAAVEALAEKPLLPTADGTLVRPRDAVGVIGADDALRAVLAEVMPGLVDDHPALERVGVRRLALADVVDLLADLRRAPAWWRQLYAALASAPGAAARESLGALPVPLADGRLVRGPRGLLVAGEPLPAHLDALGLRVVEPSAAHPLLFRLGAVEATARAVLDDPAVRAAVQSAADGPDTAEVAEVVLGLLAAADVSPGDLPWLADLPLPDERGELVPAGDLALPGTLVAEVAEPDVLGRPAPDLLDRWGSDVLAAAGVLGEFGVVVDHDVVLDDSCEHDLADEDGWLEAVDDWLGAVDDQPGGDPRRTEGLPAVLPELVAVRDLDVVRDDAWPEVLAALAGDPRTRAAVTEPARVEVPGGHRALVPSYTAWWLRTHATVDGHPPPSTATPGSELAGLYDVVRSDLDEVFLTAIGVRTSLAALLAEPRGADDLLDRLADAGRPVDADTLAGVYLALARVDPTEVTAPRRVRVRPDTVVAARDACVLDSPAHLQLAWPSPPVLVPVDAAEALAEVLAIGTTGARVPAGPALTGGVHRPVPDAVQKVLRDGPVQWWEHDDLLVAGQPVEWWVDEAGGVHACTVHGLARALAWSAGRWGSRLLLAEVLAEPARVDELLAEGRLDD